MNPGSPHDLEDRIARIPRRGLPADLREACQALARPTLPPLPAKPPETITRQLAHWYRWLWPHPVAWAAVAALWLAILGLHQLAPVPVPLIANPTNPVPLLANPESRTQLVLQRATREQLLLPPSPPLDIDRNRNPLPTFTNRIA